MLLDMVEGGWGVIGAISFLAVTLAQCFKSWYLPLGTILEPTLQLSVDIVWS